MCLRELVIIAGAVAAFAPSPIPAADEKTSDSTPGAEKDSRVAIAGYASNFHAFSFYRCSFEVTSGQAQTFADALAGKWINAKTAQYRVIKDGGKELIECLAPPLPPPSKATMVPIAEMPGRFKVAAGPSGASYLTDGDKEISYDKTLRSASLFTQRSPYGGKRSTPFSMGTMGPDNILGPDHLDANKTDWTGIYRGRTRIDDRDVLAVWFGAVQEKMAPRAREFFLDPSQGYLPFRIRLHYSEYAVIDGHAKIEVFLMQSRECSRGRWFPERSLVVTTPDKAGNEFNVLETKVLKLDTDNRPHDGDFTMEIPVGTPIRDPNDPSKGFFRLKQDERITATDLPTLFEMLDKAKSTPLMDTGIPQKSTYRWLRRVGGGVGVLLVLCAVAIVVRRHRAQVRASS